jgi:hypothetical protein
MASSLAFASRGAQRRDRVECLLEQVERRLDHKHRLVQSAVRLRQVPELRPEVLQYRDRLAVLLAIDFEDGHLLELELISVLGPVRERDADVLELLAGVEQQHADRFCPAWEIEVVELHSFPFL